MAQDLRKMFENEPKLQKESMPQGHEARFLQKLDEALPEKPKSSVFTFLNIAASVVILLGIGYFGFQFMNPSTVTDPDVENKIVAAEGIESISPQLKKVEDYYLANINSELSKLEYSPENKELFDGYVAKLDELSKEYETLTAELIGSGPNERTVTALIDNLKLRLDLLYRLKEKLSQLNNSENEFKSNQT